MPISATQSPITLHAYCLALNTQLQSLPAISQQSQLNRQAASAQQREQVSQQDR